MQDETTTEETSGFPIRFTREEFKKDILQTWSIFMGQSYYIYCTGMSGDSYLESGRKIWSLVSNREVPANLGLGEASTGYEELQLTFDDLENNAAVRTLLDLYDYGVLGVVDVSHENFDDFEGYANWVSRILHDLSRSQFLIEWDGYGGGHNRVAVENCLYICELANARLMLEGSDEGFHLDDRATEEVSIQQLALLSGMTIASIRTIASRKSGKVPLPIENRNGAAMITAEHAKEWLKAKGRYVKVTTVRTAGTEDFTTRKFSAGADFEVAIHARLNYLESSLVVLDIDAQILSTGLKWIEDPIPGSPFSRTIIGSDQLMNVELMQRLAGVLQLPPTQFALRAAEAAVQDKMREITRQLKAASAPK